MLKEEHEVIEKVLDVVDAACDKIENNGKLPSGFFEKVLDFIRTFADSCHHGKEEDVLFPAIEEKGIPKEGGPIGMMLEEHDVGRSFVKGLSEAVKNNDDKAIVENARGYVNLLRQHIPKENDILYPMADEMIGEKEDVEMVEKFEKIEEERIKGKHHEYLELVKELEKEVGT